jgi:hypothetical protein
VLIENGGMPPRSHTVTFASGRHYPFSFHTPTVPPYVNLRFHVQQFELIEKPAYAGNPINDKRPGNGIPNNSRVKVNPKTIEKAKQESVLSLVISIIVIILNLGMEYSRFVSTRPDKVRHDQLGLQHCKWYRPVWLRDLTLGIVELLPDIAEMLILDSTRTRNEIVYTILEL